MLLLVTRHLSGTPFPHSLLGEVLFIWYFFQEARPESTSFLLSKLLFPLAVPFMKFITHCVGLQCLGHVPYDSWKNVILLGAIDMFPWRECFCHFSILIFVLHTLELINQTLLNKSVNARVEMQNLVECEHRPLSEPVRKGKVECFTEHNARMDPGHHLQVLSVREEPFVLPCKAQLSTCVLYSHPSHHLRKSLQQFSLLSLQHRIFPVCQTIPIHIGTCCNSPHV